MKLIQKIGSGAVLATLLTAGVAFAQTAPNISVSVTPNTVSPVPGSNGTTVATVTLTGNQAGTYQVTSIPLTLATAGGAVPANITSCQLYNAAGTPLNTGTNANGALINGSNTIVLDSPLTLTGTTGTTLQVRCNVASGAPVSGTYTFSAAGAPAFAPALAINVAVLQTVPPGTLNAGLAVISLDATRSGQSIRINALPINASFSGASNFSACQVRNVTNLLSPLNTGANVVAALGNGLNTFTLDTPLVINAGTMTNLAVTCNVSASAPLGSTLALSVQPSAIPAVAVSSGAAVTATLAGPNGTTGLAGGAVTVGTGGTGGTPGVPNTGNGGSGTTNAILLMVFGLIAAIGAGSLVKRAL